ncbi:hypothetical protein SAY86_020383 [Trapa natans]|uniref:Uncharacterized protein n=1 Tax=Trapa natans TaxID=22666 RepID=A0AAN7R1R3_TRANT|nr:hypothetical protein SAY86_020383 [Trapa natans]
MGKQKLKAEAEALHCNKEEMGTKPGLEKLGGLENQCNQQLPRELAGVDVDPNSQEEDGYEAEEDDGMNEDGGAAGLHVSESHHLPLCRQLKQQPRAKQHEQHHRHHHRSPVCRHLSSLLTNLLTTSGSSFIHIWA